MGSDTWGSTQISRVGYEMVVSIEECCVSLKLQMTIKNEFSHKFHTIGFFNEADTLESSLILIIKTQIKLFIHKETGMMLSNLKGQIAI
jgi:hypothetical protein